MNIGLIINTRIAFLTVQIGLNPNPNPNPTLGLHD